MLIMIDNYDSFTYNLVQYFCEIGEEVRVFRNNQVSIPDLEKLPFDRLVISPGPCDPSKAGISLEAVRHFAGKVPILGVCLGHQTIGRAFGGNIVHAKQLMHGKTSSIRHDGKTLFQGIENPFIATRYHSLVVEREPLPDVLEVSAELEDGEIMGLRHKKMPIEGIQFHPESILTKAGKDLLRNFLKIIT